MKWVRNGKEIKEPIMEYLGKIFEEELSKNYKIKISVGTDSQKSGKSMYKFATVILISTSEDLGGGVIVGRGGIIVSTSYFHSFKQPNAKELVNERMIYEVGKSVEIAYEISPVLDLYDIKMEIHADINPNPEHDSNKALQQAIGYILGMGYDFKIKPESYASSNCADKLC